MAAIHTPLCVWVVVVHSEVMSSPTGRRSNFGRAHSGRLRANSDSRFRAGAPVRSAPMPASRRPGRCAPSGPRSPDTAGVLCPPTSNTHCACRWPNALASGHDSTARYLYAAAGPSITERDGGRCGLCHSPGCEFDHVEGGGSDSGDLPPLCYPLRHRGPPDHSLKPLPPRAGGWSRCANAAAVRR